MSVEACAKQWRKANEQSQEAGFKCRLCPIGPVHAGETAASMSPIKGSMICARCHEWSQRLIGKMLCVSCYNRQREWLVGENAKGTKPVKQKPLQTRKLRYMAGDEMQTLTVKHSEDELELVVAALRDSRRRVRFAFFAELYGDCFQMRLF